MAPYVYVENSTATVVPTETSESKTSKGWWRKGLTSPDFVHQEVLPHLTKKAIGYINEQAGAGQPFFLYFALPAPHTPILPSSEYIGKSNTNRSEEHTSELQSLMRISYAVFCLKKKQKKDRTNTLAISYITQQQVQ